MRTKMRENLYLTLLLQQYEVSELVNCVGSKNIDQIRLYLKARTNKVSFISVPDPDTLSLY
ncbi:MAG: hypothetical protein JWO83_3512 [Caulobacteraceae bacterium]|nr:hypothetical protein [Caulobacteraceae bacterium]